MDTKIMWLVGAGAVLLLLLLSSGSRGTQTTAATLSPVAAPDRSAQELAEIQGKYGIAGQVLNIGGTLDLTRLQGAISSQHDDASIRLIGAQGDAASHLADVQGSYAVSLTREQNIGSTALARIGADRDTSLMTIGSARDISLARTAAERDTTLGKVNADRDVSIAGIQGQYDAKRAEYDYNLALDNNRTAQAINNRNGNVAEVQAKSQEHSSAWDSVGKIVGTAAAIFALF